MKQTCFVFYDLQPQICAVVFRLFAGRTYRHFFGLDVAVLKTSKHICHWALHLNLANDFLELLFHRHRLSTVASLLRLYIVCWSCRLLSATSKIRVFENILYFDVNHLLGWLALIKVFFNKVIINIWLVLNYLLSKLKIRPVIVNELDCVLTELLQTVAVIFNDVQIIWRRSGGVQLVFFKDAKILEQ